MPLLGFTSKVFLLCHSSFPLRPMCVTFSTYQGRAGHPPWSYLAVGVAICPEISSYVFPCFDVPTFLPWCDAYHCPINPRKCRGQSESASPPTKVMMSSHHGQTWLLALPSAQRYCRSSFPVLFLLQFFRGVMPIIPSLISGIVDGDLYQLPHLPRS